MSKDSSMMTNLILFGIIVFLIYLVINMPTSSGYKEGALFGASTNSNSNTSTTDSKDSKSSVSGGGIGSNSSSYLTNLQNLVQTTSSSLAVSSNKANYVNILQNYEALISYQALNTVLTTNFKDKNDLTKLVDNLSKYLLSLELLGNIATKVNEGAL